MNRFDYLRDRLFLAACALYAVNRWLVIPHVHNQFLRFHFDDLLLIPAALPVVLFLQRRLGLRTHDAPPDAREIAFHLVVWSLLFEWAGPHLIHHAVGDPMDVLAYAVGALIAGIWWNACWFTNKLRHGKLPVTPPEA